MPIPRDVNDEMMPREKGRSKSQIQTIIDYSPQFIQKTALPAIQKSEQLQKKYSIEKKEKEQVELLEHQISLLKSELLNVTKAYRDAVNELTNFKKIDSQPPLSIGEKGNFQWCDPHSNEIIRNFDCDLEVQVMLDVKQKSPLSDLQYAVEMEEFTDLKLGLNRRGKHFDLERIAKENENKRYYENFPNLKEKLDPEDSLNLQWKPQQESSRSRKIERKYRHATVPDGAKNVKVRNASFRVKGNKALEVNYMAHKSSDENSLLTKLHDAKPMKVTSGVTACRDQRGGGSRKVEDEARYYVPYSKDEWGCTCKVSLGSQDLNELKKRRVPKTAFIDQHVFALSDSRYIQNQDEASSTLKRKVLNTKRERRFSDSRKISPASTFQSLGCIDQYRLGYGRWNKSISGIAIRSQWL